MERFWQLANEAVVFLSGWFGPSTIASLIVAFFLAGAIVVFFSREAVVKYFSSEVNRTVSYGVAAVAGTLLTVWSCTVLPLFSGIYKKGAGLGPAITFLYAAPVINITTMIYSAKLLGVDIAVARTIGSFTFAIVLGLIMAFIFRKEERQKHRQSLVALSTGKEDKGLNLKQQGILFGLLIALILLTYQEHWIVSGIALAILGIVVWHWFTKDEAIEWVKQTYLILRSIVPLVLVGAFIAGMVYVAFPRALVADFAGKNDVVCCGLTSLFGIMMYFCSLCEVPIIRAFLDLGMANGPALSLLLTGPAFSLPLMLVLFKIMGVKKTMTLMGLALVIATIMGLIFGQISGY